MRFKYFLAVFLVVAPISLQADSWSDLVDKAKQAASEIAEDVTDQVISSDSENVEETANQSTSKQPKNEVATSDPTAESAGDGNKGSYGVRNAVVDGLSLGMPTDEALNALKANSYQLDNCASPENRNNKQCMSDLLGVTVKGTRPGRTGEDVTVRFMNDTLYFFNKRLKYWEGRNGNVPEGHSIASLKQEYYDKYTNVFETTYFHKYNDTYHFDDQSPPPYNRKITTPHAVLTLQGGRRGDLIVGIDMEWKELVGASW